jgi:hypothetical protein
MTMDGLRDLERIKDIIKRLSPYEVKIEKTLSDLDQSLAVEMETHSIQMFTKRKTENKSFTIQNNAALKAMQIDEETGTLSGAAVLTASGYFRNNIEALHILAAQCHISKTAKYPADNQIFYAACKSVHCKDSVDIFFVNRHGKFLMLFDKLSEMELKTYIHDYLGAPSNGYARRLEDLGKEVMADHKTIQTEIADIFDEISNYMSAYHRLIEGAISFFDFLGWKGLWKEDTAEPLTEVSCLIEDFKHFTDEKSASLFPRTGSMKMSTLISISDTVAIFTPKITGVTEKELLSLHSDIAKHILEKSCKAGYPIRGAIAYGSYSIIDNVMIGPGIDECASWHETCDWIGAHFTPSAQFILQRGGGRDIPQNILPYTKIPVKAGVPRVKYAVKWHIEETVFDQLRQKVRAVLPEIAAKYMNTYDYLYRGEEE